MDCVSTADRTTFGFVSSKPVLSSWETFEVSSSEWRAREKHVTSAKAYVEHNVGCNPI